LVRLDEQLRETASFPLRGYGSPLTRRADPTRRRRSVALSSIRRPTIVVDASVGDGTIVIERGADGRCDRSLAARRPAADRVAGDGAEGERGMRAHVSSFSRRFALVAASGPFTTPTATRGCRRITSDPIGVRVRVRLAGATGGVVSIALAGVRASASVPVRARRTLE
jgi:hypothetical protein